MPPPPPIARFFAGTDVLLERSEPTWWGAVTTDSRFPDVYDLNYARVDSGQPDLTLDEIQTSLVPALRSAGARHFHVVLFEPEGCAGLLDQLQRAGHPLSWDTVMQFGGHPEKEPPPHRVEEMGPHDEELWRLQDLLFREFGVADPEARRQLVSWAREVLAPAGKRWFVVREGGRPAGMGSVQVRAAVGYVDDVLTLPGFRGRGVASAIVRRLVQEAHAGGAGDVVLLTDRSGNVGLYGGMGFRETGRVASALSRLEPGRQDSGSSGSD